MSLATPINISRLHFPVARLGPGRRVGIWLQGCSIQCPGCISADTWRPGLGGTTLGVVIQQIETWGIGAEGFTISGGEPFDQPEALIVLLREIRRRFTADILVFSGYSFEQLAHHLAETDGLIDALISDPFELKTPQTMALRGSDNQRLHCLTPLGIERFAPYQRAYISSDKGFDLMMDEDGTFWLAGIPSRGDFARLESLLESNGDRLLSTQASTRARRPS